MQIIHNTIIHNFLKKAKLKKISVLMVFYLFVFSVIILHMWGHTYLIFRFTDYILNKSGRQEGIEKKIKKNKIFYFISLQILFAENRVGEKRKRKNIILPYLSKLKKKT